ncbi:MAG: hypothetical protein ACREX8_06945 [Gammaproteobacteria bacterium]
MPANENLRQRASIDVHLVIGLAARLDVDHHGGNAPGMAAVRS